MTFWGFNWWLSHMSSKIWEKSKRIKRCDTFVSTGTKKTPRKPHCSSRDEGGGRRERILTTIAKKFLPLIYNILFQSKKRINRTKSKTKRLNVLSLLTLHSNMRVIPFMQFAKVLQIYLSKCNKWRNVLQFQGDYNAFQHFDIIIIVTWLFFQGAQSSWHGI